MAKVSKANRGKNRWIGLHINQMPISRAILEDNLSKIMGNINWKLFDLIDTEMHTLAILRTPLEDSLEAHQTQQYSNLVRYKILIFSKLISIF